MKNKAPTGDEIAAEIALLKAMAPKIRQYDAFGGDNRAKINAQIDALEGEIDTTSEEYEEMDPDERSCADEALAWESGDSTEKPSDGWEPLIKN